MTVTTVYATAPGGNGTISSRNSTYSTARTGGTLAGVSPHYVGQRLFIGNYYCYESHLLFDTSGIDDGDDVSAVVLSLDGTVNASDTDFTAGVAAGSYDGGQVDSGDWVSGASIPTPELATWDSSGYDAGYNAFTETSDFKSAINKTGNTALLIYSQRLVAGDVPSGQEHVVFLDADEAGTTTDPKLDITHAAGGGGPTTRRYSLSLTGVG